MGASKTDLITRTRLKLQNRQDVDAIIEIELTNQLRELSSADLMFAELEVTNSAISVAGPAKSILIDDIQLADELYAVIDVQDITNLAAVRKLEQTSVRELDSQTILNGPPTRYARYGLELLLDAKIPAASSRNFQVRYRRYHPTVDPDGSILPSVWDEVIITGAALRVTRDYLKDYDAADELEKQMTRQLRARGQITEREESKDADFGMIVRM